jgi:hypothetical protein
VSADLARRLLQTGAVTPDEIYAALLDVVVLGVPLVQALVARGAATGARVEEELARVRVPTLKNVRVAGELARRLPAGLCERLLAVPVGATPDGDVEIACVDPLDPAVATELAFHLGAPVRLLRAPLSAVMLGIERWLDERDLASERSPDERPSSPPFPLVRRSIPPSRSHVDTNPGVGAAYGAAAHRIDEQDESGEPVIGLTRSKPPAKLPRRAAVPTPEQLDFSALDAAGTADELVRVLAEIAAPLARSVWVFALKSGMHELRVVVPNMIEGARGLRLAAAERSIFDRAARDGYFLGRLPDDRLHEDLRASIGDVEVYVAPILVADRPALALLLADLAQTMLASRAADEIARRGAIALARILRSKKRG